MLSIGFLDRVTAATDQATLRPATPMDARNLFASRMV